MIKHLTLYASLLILLSAPLACSMAQDEAGEVTLRKVCDLPAELVESSGIIFYDGLLWSFNDSGNRPVLYGVDTTDCQVKRRIYFRGVSNIDWEAIAQDSEFVYIADIGNNGSSREKFQVYKLAKERISNRAIQEVNDFVTIEFTFDDDYSDFLNDFDAEAMLIHNDSILIYTKDWTGYETTALYIPQVQGVGYAKILGKYDIEGLTTSCIYSPEKGLIMLGYVDWIPFIQVLDSDVYLRSVRKSSRYDLPLFQGMQSEAITYEQDKYFLSCENAYTTQALYEVIFD